MFEASTTDPYYLIVFTKEDGGTSWDAFVTSLVTISQPFTGPAWAMILLGVLPFLGLVMFFHEYKAPDSSCPDSTDPVLIQRPDGSATAETRSIPFFKHIVNSFYTGILSFSTDPLILLL
jgi:hypothetical protein